MTTQLLEKRDLKQNADVREAKLHPMIWAKMDVKVLLLPVDILIICILINVHCRSESAENHKIGLTLP